MALRQSFCLPCFRDPSRDLVSFLREARQIGFDATELWGWRDSMDEVLEGCREAGLQIVSITGHDSIDQGLNDAAHHDRIELELRDSIARASSAGVPGVICFSGSRDPRQSDLEGLVTFARGIRRILPYAEEKGVNLNLEILNSRLDHPGYQCDRVDWALAAVEMVGSPRLGILFDVYHVQIMEGDLVRNLKRCLPVLGHVHTGGNPGRHEINHQQEICYSPISRALREGGYRGFVGHEFFPAGDKLAALREAFQVFSDQH